MADCPIGRLPTLIGGGRLIPLMCGRYASFLPHQALARLLGTVNPQPSLAPSWKVEMGIVVALNERTNQGEATDQLSRRSAGQA